MDKLLGVTKTYLYYVTQNMQNNNFILQHFYNTDFMKYKLLITDIYFRGVGRWIF